MGSIHHIENIGQEPLQLLLCFDHERPEDLNLSSAMSVMPEHVLDNTFKQEKGFFSKLSSQVNPTFISPEKTTTKSELAWQTNRFKFDIESTQPEVKNEGGTVKMSNSFLMPSLENLALYSLVLEKSGIREPHWHPNAHELNYVKKGSVRITLLSPSGQVDTFDMKEGDISFMPKGYFHYIENIGQEPASMAIFFNHTMPSDIGLSGCLGAYSNELLSSLFKMPFEYFDNLPKYQKDLFVVAGGG